MEKILDPVNPELLKAELTPEKKLCDTNKAGNEIYVVDCLDAPNVLLEIGRLREISFRDSGGGTGLSVDLDEFDTTPDRPYKQIVVWDPEASAIIGGYRYILGPDIKIQADGQPHLTSSHMFHYSDKFINEYLPHVMELGRSFVRPEYQSSKAGAKAIFALDNLWDGIAAVIFRHPNIFYLIGKMTIYPAFDASCRELIQHFLWKHFPDPDELVRPKNPVLPVTDGRLLDLILKDADFKSDYRNLKDAIRRLGSNIPPLVNSYMNISPTMKMLGTGINDLFFDAYETGIMIHFDEIYEDKRDRHKQPYLRHLAEKIRKRFPGIRQEEAELAKMLSAIKESRRVQQINKFLDNQKEHVAEAEKRLRRKLRRRGGRQE